MGAAILGPLSKGGGVIGSKMAAVFNIGKTDRKHIYIPTICRLLIYRYFKNKMWENCITDKIFTGKFRVVDSRNVKPSLRQAGT